MTTRKLSLILCVAVLTAGLTLLVHAQEAAPGASDKAEPADAAGNWTYSFEGFNGATEVTIRLQQEGDKLHGSVTGFGGNDDPIDAGAVTGNQITFSVSREFGDQTAVTTYTGTLDGDTFKGKSETVFTREFEATREAQTPDAAQE